MIARSRLDISILFATRTTRLFAYGFLSVVLVLYLVQVGLQEQAVGLLLSLTLFGDAGISLWLTTSADRLGRKRMLIVGALLMVLAGGVFILTNNYLVLVAAAIIGVISPSGNEIGPFLSIEQAALSQLVPDARRTQVFAWYNLAGSIATAVGALAGGFLAQRLQELGWTPLAAYQAVLSGYILCGVLLALLFLRLSPDVETSTAPVADRRLGLHRSRGIVARLSALFALDAFAGGFIISSLIAYWFHLKFGVPEGVLGSIFFGANLLAGLSSLLAARIASKFGLINTMVFTHVPSNLLLILVPLMPTLELAVAMLFLRFSISQMDVPTRQSYTMAVVAPDERSAASGVTSIARSLGAAVSPALSAWFIANPGFLSMPFFLAGGLKLIYDAALFFSFQATKPPEETMK